MLDGLEGIMNLAAASGESLGTTSDIVTDALTAFGLSAADSGHFADILAAASSNANTNVAMMGETFKYCAPVAGALGFSAEDTAEAIGLMANAGIKSSQAGTALRTIMNTMAGPIELVGENLGEVTIQTTNADGSMRELSDILADCRVAFSQLSESEKASTAQSLMGKNAMSGFLALMNAGEGDITKLSAAIADCDGTAERMAVTMQDNLSGQLTILMSQLQELAISFGTMLMPAIRDIVSKIQQFVDRLNGMSDAQPLLIIIGTVISKTGTAMKGFVSLAKGLGKMKVAVSSANGVCGKLGAVLGGISGPVLAVVAVIGVLAAAFIDLWKNNEDFRDGILATWEKIKETASSFAQGIVDRLNTIGISFGDILNEIRTIWNAFCQVLAPVFEGAFQAIAVILESVLGMITGILDVFIGLFTGNWDNAWNGMKEVFSSLWNGIKGVLSVALDTIRNVVDVFLGWFGASWGELWSSARKTFENVWEKISGFFSDTWELICNIVKTPAFSIHLAELSRDD